ncbi:MAG: histidinol dehydrogenase [Leptospiraceae bacterium]|nr:histidinol dehydrogenase [Leptospiraceae bacterium]
MIKIITVKSKDSLIPYLSRAKNDLAEAIFQVIPILEDVKKNGDIAVRNYTKKFDGIELKKVSFDPKELVSNLTQEQKQAFEVAKKNITEFHKLQLQDGVEKEISGNRLGFKFTPMERVGVYAPGGKALYPSSVLMGAIPAKLANVKEVHLFTPPGEDGNVPDSLIYAAQISGIDRIHLIGGAQAIAAAGYGTETIPKVDFIVGPGNRYVAAAKAYLSGIGQIGIESIAGPSEVFIIADETANPEWVACDLLSQAEHGEDSVAILACTSQELATNVSNEIEKALRTRTKRKEMKEAAIYNNSAIFIFSNIDECIEFSNEFAPEHLEIITKNFEKDFEKITNAGSVFLGSYSPVAMGDYITGTNHVLPTAGLCKIYSSLGVDNFRKRITYQEVRKDSLKNLYPYVKILSDLEGLDEEHGTSVLVRTL